MRKIAKAKCVNCNVLEKAVSFLANDNSVLWGAVLRYPNRMLEIWVKREEERINCLLKDYEEKQNEIDITNLLEQCKKNILDYSKAIRDGKERQKRAEILSSKIEKQIARKRRTQNE